MVGTSHCWRYTCLMAIDEMDEDEEEEEVVELIDFTATFQCPKQVSFFIKGKTGCIPYNFLLNIVIIAFVIT